MMISPVVIIPHTVPGGVGTVLLCVIYFEKMGPTSHWEEDGPENHLPPLQVLVVTSQGISSSLSRS
jgi:hypothetical protein